MEAVFIMGDKYGVDTFAEYSLAINAQQVKIFLRPFCDIWNFSY